MKKEDGSAPELIRLADSWWINSKPLKLRDLKGKVVLLDFWAYSCVNCLRTFKALKELWDKYGDKGLVIIGIHTPEFEFEREIGNVRKAVKKHGLEYPVVNDPQGINWQRYGGGYWPRAALIDAQGNLVFEHIGEAGYDEVEREILKELIKIGKTKGFVKKLREKQRVYPFGMTPELYCGFRRNRGFGSSKACSRNGCDSYVDNEEGRNYEMGIIHLQGDWKQEDEYIEYVGKPADSRKQGEAYLSLKFYASEVNVVLSGKGKAKIVLNGSGIPVGARGKDLDDDKSQSFVKTSFPDMYNILDFGAATEDVLKIIPFPGLRIYSFTFG